MSGDAWGGAWGDAWGGAWGAVDSSGPPVVPPIDAGGRASAFAPGAMGEYREDEKGRIRRQNDLIMAIVISAVTQRLLE